MPAADEKTNLTAEQHNEVRAQVRELLQRTQAFDHLPTAERSKFANALVGVLSYLADPTAAQPGLARDLDPNGKLLELVTGQAENGNQDAHQPKDKAKGGAKAKNQGNSPSSTTAGEEFTGAATDQAGEKFEQLTKAVDFPKFVSGLVEGVFTSIVDSSIRQMQEYGKFLEAVVKSVNEFKNEHITESDARESVVDRFPEFFEIQSDGEKPVLAQKPGAGMDEDAAPDLKGAFGYDGEADISDPENEAKLVDSARLQMARMRQQQLATMVLLGINRIVVTNGHINAKVFIDVSAVDSGTRRNYASERDRATEYDRESKGRSWLGRESSNKVKTSVSTAYSSSKSETEAEAKVRANLSGSVRINFKSETFPLEKIGSPSELTAINSKSART